MKIPEKRVSPLRGASKGRAVTEEAKLLLCWRSATFWTGAEVPPVRTVALKLMTGAV